MTARFQITLEPALQRRAQAKAAELGISFPLANISVASGLGAAKRKFDASIPFDLIDEAPPTEIARDKNKMVGEAVSAEYLRKTGRKPRRPRIGIARMSRR